MGCCVLKIVPMGLRDINGVRKVRKVLHGIAPGEEKWSLYRFILSICYVLSIYKLLRDIIYFLYPRFSFVPMVAREDRKVIGIVWLQGTGNKGIVDAGIAVLPEYQGRGIGTKLHKKRELVAKRMGAKRIEVSTRPDNYQNEAILAKRGYKVMHTFWGKDL